MLKWIGQHDAESANENAEEVFYDCRETQKRRNARKSSAKPKDTCHRHLKFKGKTRKCAAPEMCKFAKKTETKAGDGNSQSAATEEPVQKSKKVTKF